MTWSFRLGKLFGIDVRVHLTFVMLLGGLGLWALFTTGSVLAAALNVLVVVALFGIVVLHEYGHALTARAFHIRTRNITLYPIGGMAMLERLPSNPREQLLIAVAGPAVNFVLAGVAALAAALLGVDVLAFFREVDAEPQILESALAFLFYANMLMGVFNLLPATPMDGGRVLRALLNLRMPSLRAARIATKVGRVVAVLMGIYALLIHHPMLLLIAMFVWFSSGAELAAEERLASTRFGSPEPHPNGGPSIEILDADGHIVGLPDQHTEGRFVLRVVDGPFGKRLRLERLD